MLMEQYLWRHEPMVSDEPEQLVTSYLQEFQEDEVIEAAVYKLKNNKYLSICYMGCAQIEHSGNTEYEEFDNIKEALDSFHNYIEGN